MAARKPDQWLTSAQKQNAAELSSLLETLEDTSVPKLETRFTVLAGWPRNPAIAGAAVAHLQTFPVRFREQLGAPAAAVGVALIHGAKPSALAKLKKAKNAANDVVPAWRETVAGALVKALARRTKAPAAGKGASKTALPAGPRAALQEAWLAMAARRAPDDLPALLERLGDLPATDITERLVALIDFPTDARIGDAAARLIEKSPVRMSAENPLFSVLALVLSVHGHRAHRDAVRRLVEHVPALSWAEQVLPDADAPETKATPSVAPSSEAAFLAWIAEAPADRARRHAFADWLLERGNPRGELMSLQLASLERPLSPAEAKRAGALQKKHEKEWLKPFGRGVRKGTARFSGGLLASVELSMWNASDVPDASEPQLATLEALVLDGGTNLPLAELVASARWPSLKALTVPGRLLPSIPPEVRDRLEALGVLTSWAGNGDDEESALRFLDVTPFPRVRQVSLHGGVRRAKAKLGAWLRALDTLSVESAVPDEWFAAVHGAKLTTLEVHPQFTLRAGKEATVTRFTRSAEGAWSLRVTVNAVPPEYEVTALATSLARLPADVRGSFTLEGVALPEALAKKLASVRGETTQ